MLIRQPGSHDPASTPPHIVRARWVLEAPASNYGPRSGEGLIHPPPFPSRARPPYGVAGHLHRSNLSILHNGSHSNARSIQCGGSISKRLQGGRAAGDEGSSAVPLMSQEKWGQGRGLGGFSLSLHECTVKSNIGSALMDSKMI